MAVSSSHGTVFRQAVSTVLREWQALRIAVDNMFGGPMSKEKALWLEGVTADFVYNNCKNRLACPVIIIHSEVEYHTRGVIFLFLTSLMCCMNYGLV